jgi:periplasmic divalent cation tolerance protein
MPGASPNTDARIVLTTFDDPEKARQFARALMERRLAACVNLVENVRSIYRWQGKVQEAPEILLIIKTVEARIEPLRQAFTELHPYELPELVVLEIADGSPEYLGWLGESCSPRQ